MKYGTNCLREGAVFKVENFLREKSLTAQLNYVSVTFRDE
jgi:hypothetical protein